MRRYAGLLRCRSRSPPRRRGRRSRRPGGSRSRCSSTSTPGAGPGDSTAAGGRSSGSARRDVGWVAKGVPVQLVDGFGRVHADLRVSLTDRCNLRCTYCMPAEGLPWLPSTELLTDDEIVRLVGIAVGLGITEVRFTGGEPTLRPGLV